MVTTQLQRVRMLPKKRKLVGSIKSLLNSVSGWSLWLKPLCFHVNCFHVRAAVLFMWGRHNRVKKVVFVLHV